MTLHLNRTEEVLLGLLKAGLGNGPVEMEPGFSDWYALVGLAKRQAVLGVIAKTILSNKALETALTKDLRLKLKSFIVNSVLISDHLDRALIDVTTALEQHGIRPVLLKGRGLSVHYPYPELRQCGDIDIYIPDDKILTAYHVLESMVDRLDDQKYVNCGKHFTASKEDIQIEIHRFVSTHIHGRQGKTFGGFAKFGLKENLVTIAVGDMKILTPEPTFNAFYIFDHLFEHFMTSGVGLRQMSDWMLFLQKNINEIDRDRLYEMLVAMDMLEPWKAFGAVLVNYLGMPASDLPFHDPSVDPDEVLAYIMADGNFGKDSAYYQNKSRFFLLGKLQSLGWHIARGLRMMRLFPRQEVRHFIFIVLNALQYIGTHFKVGRKSKTNG